ncbi:G patch domain-containing protein 4 isoform X2 [Sceloporus undulatus]|nr:G patch domain-containing protein 4 isoform X2 [Sceloporus undulatus]
MEEEEKEERSGALAFAEKQLRRHGWKKGKGLGKRENGISEAIRVKVKCDTAGVGHNSAEQFSFHWWDHLFNSSAANISVETGQDGVKVQKVSEHNGSVTNKKLRKAHGERDMLYGRFVKAATLTSGREEPSNPVPSSDSSDEDEKLDLSTAGRLTDEELVQACGGRTAHKGARHGLTMRAKLARLEEQEKAFLASHLQRKAAQKETESALEGSKRKKKKKSRRAEDGFTEEAVSSEGLEVMGEEERPKKKKKGKKRKREEDENVGEEPWMQTVELKAQKKAKRKKK